MRKKAKIRIKIMDKSGVPRFRTILKKNKSKYAPLKERAGRFKVWEKVKPLLEEAPFYRNLAAVSYSGLNFEDARVWFYSNKKDAITPQELDIELKRMCSAMNFHGFYKQGAVRFEINEPTIEMEPTNARVETFYSYAAKNGYEYNGEKKVWGWDIRNAGGNRVSRKTRLEEKE